MQLWLFKIYQKVMKEKLFEILLVTLFVSVALADVKPHALFTDGAVLQQGMPLPVWGHPANKEPVGVRLALAARAVAYGEKVEYSGPLFKSLKTEGNRAILSFDHTGGGLVAKGGDLKGFTIAGRDGKFVPAKGEIVGETVVATSPEITAPVAVRYAWSNIPDVNLFNQEGLPASPFRTDFAEESAVRIEKDVAYLPLERTEKTDLYLPLQFDPGKTYPGIIIIHGGGWSGGDKDSLREQNIGLTLAAHGYVCMSINYALVTSSSPAFPQNIQDCKRAVRWMRKNAARFQLDTSHIGAIGGSAGLRFWIST